MLRNFIFTSMAVGGVVAHWLEPANPGVQEAFLPIVIAGVGLALQLSGALSAGSAERRERARLQQLSRRVRRLSSPEKFKKILAKLKPIFREFIAGDELPRLQSATATQLARRGLTGTGVGTAIATGAEAAAPVLALQQAIPAAQQLQQQQINAALGVPQPVLGGTGGQALGQFGAGTLALGLGLLPEQTPNVGNFQGTQVPGRSRFSAEFPQFNPQPQLPPVAPLGSLPTGFGQGPF